MGNNIELNINDFQNELLELQKQNQSLLRKYQTIVDEFHNLDLKVENQNLKKQLKQIKDELFRANQWSKQLDAEKKDLKFALNEFILQDKLKIVGNSKEKLKVYFNNATASNVNELSMLEQQAIKKINNLATLTAKELESDKVDFEDKYQSLLTELKDKIKGKREQLKAEKESIYGDISSSTSNLAKEEVSEEKILSYIKKHSTELTIGSSWINKIGIIFILLAVGTAFQYTYSHWFTPEIKGISAFALSFIFLGAGEYFFRKKFSTFALGLTGGGAAIMYLSSFFCHFLLNIIGINTLVAMTVVITMGIYFLSARYKSQTVCAFGLIGGNIPIFTYFMYHSWNTTAIITAMTYSLLLNCLTLIFSAKYRWQIISYISFAVSNIVMVVLNMMVSEPIIGIVYSLILFVIFNFVVIRKLVKEERPAELGEKIILLINAVINSLMVYFLCDKFSAQIGGVYAAVYSVMYFLCGILSAKYLKDEKQIPAVAYILSTVFAVLFIPLQLNVYWYGMGWLVESVILSYVGLKKKNIQLQLAGIVTLVLSLLMFSTIIDPVSIILCIGKIGIDINFLIKYASTLFGLMLVTLMFSRAYKDEITTFPIKKIINGVWVFVIFNVYCFIQYYIFKGYYSTLPDYTHSLPIVFFFQVMIYITVMAIFIKAVFRKELIRNRVFLVTRMVFNAIFALIVLVTTIYMPVLSSSFFYSTALNTFGLIALVGANLTALLYIKYVVEGCVKVISDESINISIYSITSLALVLDLLLILHVQLFFALESPIITVVILLYGLYAIYTGLSKFDVILRRIGLGAVFIATAKLFLLDLSFSEPIYKIISYFAFGIVFILISYVYQRTKNKFEATLRQSEEEEE